MLRLSGIGDYKVHFPRLLRAFLYTRGMNRFHSHRRSEATGDPLPQQARLWNQFRGRVGNGCSRQRREVRMKMRNLFVGLFMVLAWLMSGCGSNSYMQTTGIQYPADKSGTYTFTLAWTGGSLTVQGTLKQAQWTL